MMNAGAQASTQKRLNVRRMAVISVLSDKLSLKTPNNPPNGSYFGIKTFLMSGKLKGEMLNPLFNHSESYSKAQLYLEF